MARPLSLSDEPDKPAPSPWRIRAVAAMLVIVVVAGVGGVIYGVIHFATAPLPPSPKTTDGDGYLDMLSKAKQKSEGLAASSNMRQLIQAMLVQKATTGRWPRKLEELRDGLGPMYDKLMTNPRTGENPGFIYEPPKRGEPADTPILYESLDGKPDPEGAKGFADARVEPGKPAVRNEK